jgi:hypothetical protein
MYCAQDYFRVAISLQRRFVLIFLAGIKSVDQDRQWLDHAGSPGSQHLLRHFCEAVAEGVDDEFEAIGDVELGKD